MRQYYLKLCHQMTTASAGLFPAWSTTHTLPASASRYFLKLSCQMNTAVAAVVGGAHLHAVSPPPPSIFILESLNIMGRSDEAHFVSLNKSLSLSQIQFTPTNARLLNSELHILSHLHWSLPAGATGFYLPSLTSPPQVSTPSSSSASSILGEGTAALW